MEQEEGPSESEFTDLENCLDLLIYGRNPAVVYSVIASTLIRVSLEFFNGNVKKSRESVLLVMRRGFFMQSKMIKLEKKEARQRAAVESEQKKEPEAGC